MGIGTLSSGLLGFPSLANGPKPLGSGWEEAGVGEWGVGEGCTSSRLIFELCLAPRLSQGVRNTPSDAKVQTIPFLPPVRELQAVKHSQPGPGLSILHTSN